jgi:hypothetical protein
VGLELFLVIQEEKKILKIYSPLIIIKLVETKNIKEILIFQNINMMLSSLILEQMTVIMLKPKQAQEMMNLLKNMSIFLKM